MRTVWCGSLYCLSFSASSRRYSTPPTPVSAISQISRGCRDVALRVGALRSNLRREYSMIFFGAAQGSFIVLSVFIIAFSQGGQPGNPWSSLALLSSRTFGLASRGSIFHSSRRDAAVARTSSNCCCCSDGCLLRGNERPLCAPQTEPKHVLLLMP